jgi:C1A family cysteine protease
MVYTNTMMSLLVFFAFLAHVVNSHNIIQTSFYGKIFTEWVQRFEIEFTNEQHMLNVFSKWVANHLYIQQVNNENKTYSLGHNQFSGMDNDEFRAYLGTNGRVDGDIPRVSENTYLRVGALPSSVDWVAKGAVTPVKDQGQCGSCWSFSTTGALEGAYFLKYGTLVSYSEQQLVDCDTFTNGGRDHGCNGGLMDNAFTWVGKNGGLCKESDYPYVSGVTKTAGTCQTSCKLVSGSKILKYVDVAPNSDNSFMTALAQQPVSIAIEADQRDFQLYKSGVFTGTCGTNLDHGVLAVGYGTEAGQDYYKVKNSWSTSWGENGYIRLGRGSQFNNGQGQCGLLMEASYPVV